MAFEYLSDEQARRYGAFVTDPSPEELERFFFLNAEALELARTKRRRHNRLGWVILSPQVSIHDVHELG